MQTTTVTVLADRLKDAQQTLDRFIKKANRLGVHGLTYTVARLWDQERKRRDWTGKERVSVTHWADLEVSAAPLSVGNYTFLARLEVTSAGVLVDQVPGTEGLESKWMHWGGECEHCRVIRARKHLFVVREQDTGRQMAVGRSCLRVFLGTDSLGSIAAYFSFWDSVTGGSDDEDGGWASMRSYRFVMNIESILAMTAVAVRLFGWCGAEQAREKNLTPTAGYVRLGIEGPSKYDSEEIRARYKRLRSEYTQADELQAQEILAWVQDAEADSPYMNNLQVLFAERQIFDPKRVSLVVSAYSAWHRANERELRKTAPDLPESKWLGKEKERVRNLPVIFDGAFVIGESAYGERVLASFHTEQGNVLKWFTGRGVRAEPGDRLLLTGTVAKHDEYKGVRQTVLSRCVVSMQE